MLLSYFTQLPALLNYSRPVIIHNKINKMFKPVLFSLFAVLAALTLQAQTVTQNIRLSKGQKLESVVNTTMSMSQEMMGQQVEFNSTSALTTVTEVKDVTPQAFLLSNLIKRIVTNTSVMGQEMKFDSDKQEDMDGQMGAEMKGKINVPQNFSVNKQGKITDVKDTATAGASESMMSGLIGSTMVKGTVFPLLSPFPTKAVKAGDSWTDSTGTPETMKMVNTYTLKQITGNEATLEIVGQMAKTGVVEQQGMQIPMNLTGTITGISVYDISQGTLKKNQTAMKINGTMELMGQSIPLKMNTTAETTVNKAP